MRQTNSALLWYSKIIRKSIPSTQQYSTIHHKNHVMLLKIPIYQTSKKNLQVKKNSWECYIPFERDNHKSLIYFERLFKKILLLREKFLRELIFQLTYFLLPSSSLNLLWFCSTAAFLSLLQPTQFRSYSFTFCRWVVYL